MNKLLIAAIAAAGVALFASCNAVQTSQEDIIESRSTATLTKDEANAMIAHLLEKNAHIDYDADSLDQANAVRGQIFPIQVRFRVSLYRFYSGIQKVNDRYVQTKTAKDLNISSRLYDDYMAEIVDNFNKILDNLDERRKNGEDVSNVYVSDLADSESHNQLLHIQ